jgi:hypothetical protein
VDERAGCDQRGLSGCEKLISVEDAASILTSFTAISCVQASLPGAGDYFLCAALKAAKFLKISAWF